ncbi:MAG: AAA family ATPase [Adlercreutzia equolifaciens]
MIDEIQVKDVALIREASLSPSPGLTVLTGETGAGKTALVSAVKLLVGERADSSYVREGAKNAEVRGRLFPSDPAAEELVAVRKVSADGRSRATINGAMASVSELCARWAFGGALRQHEYQSLLKPAEHGRILDGWADLKVP